MSIPCQCHTNLDDYQRYEWPKELACRPIVGDCIQTLDGKKALKIVRITHSIKKLTYLAHGAGGIVPVLLLELHN